MRLRTLTSTLAAAVALTLVGPGVATGHAATSTADPAARSTAPTVTGVLLPERLGVTSYASVPVALAIDVPEGARISSVHGRATTGKRTSADWELLSTGERPEDYQDGTLGYDSSELGIGASRLVETLVRYYPAGSNTLTEVVQEVTSNTMTVKQAVTMSGAIYRYQGSPRSEATARLSYFDVAAQEYRDLKGAKVQVRQQLVKKAKGKKAKKVWSKVATLKTGKDGSARKDFRAKSVKKSYYQLVYKGTKKIVGLTLRTQNKV